MASNCNNDSGQSGEAVLSRADVFRIYLAIDRQLVREAMDKRATFAGLSGPEMAQFDELLSYFISYPTITDEDLYRIADTGVEGLGNIFSDIWNGAKSLVSKMGEVTKTVWTGIGNAVTWAAKGVVKMATFPVRVAAEIALKVFKGPLAKFFVYAFIPETSAYLKGNPEVKRKREVSNRIIDALVNIARFNRDYILKHIRNCIVSNFKKTPEDVIHDIIGKKDSQLSGEPVSFVTLALSLAPLIPSVIGLIQNPNAPSSKDWPQPVKPAVNITNDPAKKGGSKFTEFITSPLGIAAGVALAGGVGVAVYAFAE